MLLLAPFDPYLQGRDRELLVPVADHRKELWRTLGRPGAVVAGGEVVGTRRPREYRGALGLEVERWRRFPKQQTMAVEAQADRLAAHRGVEFAGVRF